MTRLLLVEERAATRVSTALGGSTGPRRKWIHRAHLPLVHLFNVVPGGKLSIS